MNIDVKKVIKKENKIHVLKDIGVSASLIARDISVYLGEQIDELNVNSYKFKSSLELCIINILSHLLKSSSPVGIFPDSVPGFTTMVFRDLSADKEVMEVKDKDFKGINSNLVASVINGHFEKNEKKIIYIETEDLVLLFFPVGDTKKNLKELGLYIL